MIKRRILIYGHDSSLLETRAALVRKAGFIALCAFTRSEVEKLIEAESADALILCHTVSGDEDQALLLKARTLHPGIKTLVLSAAYRATTLQEDIATVDVWEGPQVLMKTLETLFVVS